MDGQLDGPLNLGKTSAKTFLNDCVPIVKGYFDRNPTNPKFGITVLSANETS